MNSTIVINKTDINNVMRALLFISKKSNKDGRKILRQSAKPLIDEIKFRAPQSEKDHYRYSKGTDQIYTYKPGNLAASFKILPLRRTSAIIVGAKVDKTGKSGIYGPGKANDGYYAHMVEFGTINYPAQPFVRPALQSAQGEVLKIAVEKFKKYIELFDNKV